MSDVETWDADDFEPELPSAPRFADDKWEGEDEDDNVKDNWEDEDEEETNKPQAAQTETQAYQRPKKKPLAERLAEKEAQKQKEKEERETKEKEEKRELTAEEKLAEKIRIQKIQEHDSLNLAKGLFGVQESSNLDKMFPSSEEEFGQFKDALKSKITLFEESPHYQAFLSKLLNDLAVGLGVDEAKKLGIALNSLYHEKDKQRKETEKKKKKKSKVSIKVDRADDFDLISDATGGGGNYYDDDDFI
ncbi:eukaryotic translation initiation factor 3 subunit J-A-like [Babylonia areolata]|uniref:eukaryotic translation initiation factor 3 subunit J-A-like n=1 Tax=Babylonia areolata TaxID=304850 RepID=UPI003FD023F8